MRRSIDAVPGALRARSPHRERRTGRQDIQSSIYSRPAVHPAKCLPIIGSGPNVKGRRQEEIALGDISGTGASSNREPRRRGAGRRLRLLPRPAGDAAVAPRRGTSRRVRTRALSASSPGTLSGRHARRRHRHHRRGARDDDARRIRAHRRSPLAGGPARLAQERRGCGGGRRHARAARASLDDERRRSRGRAAADRGTLRALQPRRQPVAGRASADGRHPRGKPGRGPGFGHRRRDGAGRSGRNPPLEMVPRLRRPSRRDRGGCGCRRLDQRYRTGARHRRDRLDDRQPGRGSRSPATIRAAASTS